MLNYHTTKRLKERVRDVGYKVAYKELDIAMSENADDKTVDRYENLHKMQAKVKMLEAMFPDHTKII